MIVGVDQPIEVWEHELPAPEPGGVTLASLWRTR